MYFPIKGLTLDQVDTLWTCLATDPECGDEALSWFLNQAGNKDQHALGLETFKHIFFNKVCSFCEVSVFQSVFSSRMP